MNTIRSYTRSVIIFSSLVSLGLMIYIAMSASKNLGRMSVNNAELYAAYRISELLKTFRSQLVAFENRQQAYLVTGDSRYRDEMHKRETEIRTCLQQLEKYFAGKPEGPDFDKLLTLTYEEMQHSQNIPGVPEVSPGRDRESPRNEEILKLVDRISVSLGTTTQLLIDRSVTYVNDSRRRTLLEVILGVSVTLLAVVILLRDINLRNKLEVQLRIAKKRADDNALVKEQFMANMSHEIRTPLNAVIGFSDLIRKTRLDDQQKEYVDAINNSAANLLNIINDILDFSKIEAGKLLMEQIAFSPAEVMDSVRTMFERPAHARHLKFLVSTGKDVPTLVHGDPTRLSQILVNLTGNALKFTSNGSVLVTCELKEITRQEAALVFTVKDTGIGIPEDHLEQVFERFNQGNSETTRKFGGTGLGLAIVKSLVELHNGDIQVKSREGEGTEFIVTIKYPVATQVEPNVSAELPRLPQGGTVLLVEDNELNQRLAEDYLKGFGLNVDIAGNGQEAVERLRHNTYDLVLMDIQMPVMDGLEATKKIRQELSLEVPIVAMTAHLLKGEREKCLAAGMNDCLAKPFLEKDLHMMVSQYFHIQQSPKNLSPAIENGKVVNLTQLHDVARGNPAFLKDMINLFLEKNPDDIETIRKAIDDGDHDAVRMIAHRMKTSLGFMGLTDTLVPLDRIETLAAAKHDMSEIQPLFNTVRSQCSMAKDELSQIKNALA